MQFNASAPKSRGHVSIALSYFDYNFEADFDFDFDFESDFDADKSSQRALGHADTTIARLAAKLAAGPERPEGERLHQRAHDIRVEFPGQLHNWAQQQSARINSAARAAVANQRPARPLANQVALDDGAGPLVGLRAISFISITCVHLGGAHREREFRANISSARHSKVALQLNSIISDYPLG